MIQMFIYEGLIISDHIILSRRTDGLYTINMLLACSNLLTQRSKSTLKKRNQTETGQCNFQNREEDIDNLVSYAICTHILCMFVLHLPFVGLVSIGSHKLKPKLYLPVILIIMPQLSDELEPRKWYIFGAEVTKQKNHVSIVWQRLQPPICRFVVDSVSRTMQAYEKNHLFTNEMLSVHDYFVGNYVCR